MGKKMSGIELLNFIDALDDFVFIMDSMGNILDINQSAVNRIGIEKKELLKKSIFAIQDPDQVQKTKQMFQNLGVNDTHICKVSLMDKDGKPIPVESKVSVRKNNGDILYYCISRDMSDRIHIEHELSVYQKKLEQEQRLFIGGPVIVFKWQNNPGWSVEYVSENIFSQFGYRPEEFLGGEIPYANIIFPEDSRRVAEEVRYYSESKVNFFEQYYRMYKKNGDLRWVYDYTMILRDDKGKISGYQGYVLDITEQKRLEMEIIDNKLWLYTMLNSIGDGIISLDMNGCITFLNPPAEVYTAYNSNEAIGKNVGDVLYLLEGGKHGSLQAHIESFLKGGMCFKHCNDAILLNRNGIEIPIEYKISPIMDETGSITGKGMVLFFHDISHHKKMEKELRAFNVYYRNLIEASVDAIFSVDHYGKITDINAAAEHIIGNTRNEIVGKPFRHFFIDGDRAESAYRHAFEYGALNGTKIQMLAKNNTILWVLLNTATYKDISGNCVGVVAIARDITELESVYDSLQDSNDKLRSVIEQCNDGIVIVNEEGRITEWNHAQEEITGKQESEAVGSFIWDVQYSLMPKDLRNEAFYNELKSMISKALVTGEGDFLYKTRDMGYIFDDGSKKFIQTSVFPIRTSRGHMLGSLSRDITKQKSIEMELSSSEKKFRDMFENHSSIMLLLEKNGKILDANHSAAHYYGYSRDVLKNMNISEINQKDKERLLEAIENALLLKRNYYFWQHRLASGEIRDVEDYITPIEVEGKHHLFCIIHDISDKIKAENELHELNLHLVQRVGEELSKSREKDKIMLIQSRQAAMGEIIGNIAHQWRKPLTHLCAIIQNLCEYHHINALDNEKLNAFKDQSMTLIDHMSKTIDDFRDFYKPLKEKRAFRVMDYIKKSLSIVEASLKDHQIKLTLTATDDNLEIIGYPNEFSQALINILNNSFDVMLERQIQNPEITIALGRKNGSILLSITDNGGGIDEASLPKIFEPYFTTRQEGTGIGLYIAKVIIEEHLKGFITVRNNAVGAEFFIEIPVC